MHYELWGLDAGNLIAKSDSETEVLAIVRSLLESGWSADELSLGLEPDADEAVDRATLPVWEGPALERLARAAA